MNFKLNVGIAVMGLLACASTVMADAGGPLPDAGSSALLLLISLLGIGAVRKFLGKK
jgi:hypothetical protein